MTPRTSSPPHCGLPTRQSLEGIALSSAMKKIAKAAKLLAEKQLRTPKTQQAASTLLLKRIVRVHMTLWDLALGQVEKALI